MEHSTTTDLCCIVASVDGCWKCHNCKKPFCADHDKEDATLSKDNGIDDTSYDKFCYPCLRDVERETLWQSVDDAEALLPSQP